MDTSILSQINQNQPVIVYSPAYLAGLIDSDGSISISRAVSKNSRRGHRYICFVEIGQHRNDNLFGWLIANFGGGLSRNNNGVPKWRVYGASSISFLQTVYPYLLLKKEEADCVLKCVSLITDGKNLLSDEEDRIQYDCCQKSKALKAFRYSSEKKLNQLLSFDFDYLAGVVDCEGSFDIRRKKGTLNDFYCFNFTLMQHRTDDLLAWLERRFGGAFNAGYGSRNEPAWRINGRTARRFLEAIIFHLRLKRVDVEISLNFLDTVQFGGIRLPQEIYHLQGEYYSQIRIAREQRQEA